MSKAEKNIHLKIENYSLDQLFLEKLYYEKVRFNWSEDGFVFPYMSEFEKKNVLALVERISKDWKIPYQIVNQDLEKERRVRIAKSKAKAKLKLLNLERIDNLNIEIHDQILFLKGESLFVGTVTEIREAAVQADYTWLSSWNGGAGVVVFEYTMWIPKSVIERNVTGVLTVKKWFISKGMNADKIFHIKKYYLENGVKKYI
jgi:hypothetical protein